MAIMMLKNHMEIAMEIIKPQYFERFRKLLLQALNYPLVNQLHPIYIRVVGIEVF